MRKAALGIGCIALLALAAGAWLLTDLNRFRPQVEALIAERTGLGIELGGDLGWRLLPAPAVTAALVQADDGTWQVDDWAYNPILDRHSARGLQFKTQGAQGRCDLEFRPRHSASASPQAGAQWIVPIHALRQVNGSGRCQGVRLHFAKRNLEHLAAEFEVAHGIADIDLQAPGFLGGTAAARIELDASAEPLDWTVRFNADSLQTQRFRPWLGETAQWEAEVEYAGEWRAQGNSALELAASIVGQSRLNGGPGRIGAPFLDRIKQAVSPFARGSGRAAPGAVQYQSVTATWSIEGATQRLEFALDNLAVEAAGEYRIAEDRLDITAKVAIEEGAEDAAFDANPLLTGMPIPLRCAGTLAEPGCELDDRAVRQLLAEAAQDGSEMQRKLDAIIEEKLPPNQRRAARAVLRLLSGSIERP